ncbi:TonB-dependent receptor [Sphingomonas crocodyli]|uniref:TonB-dependent receptor n=2 Tax=Sphingomonas crocodyli TaxID=1979270 RepID=A0A437M9L0_9SPHN|nr:TonB-dependent receptor [Sphingomonas crocodyli]
MVMSVFRRYLFAGTALALAGVAAPGWAQTADTAAPAAPAVNDDQVAEIVVTATKRAESAQKVPISMSVVSGEQLEAFRATDVRSVMNAVPNLFVQQTAGNDVIYIRGFGSPPSNFSFDSAVSLYMDGVYAGRVRQAPMPFFDVGRVEVLRGPQGALFGKNTAAGAISIVSAGPTDSFQAGATALYDFKIEGYDANAYISGPITENLGFRVAGRIQNQDGYIRNEFNGKKEPENKNWMVRTTLKWEPSEKFDSTLKFEYVRMNRTGGQNVSGPLTTRPKADLTRYSVDSPLGREGYRNRSWILSNTANFYLGDYTLTSVTGYSRYKGTVINDFDQAVPTGGVTANSVYNSYPEDFDQFSQEIRLLSPTGRTIDFIVGAYYDDSTYHLDQFGGFNIASLNYFGLLNTFFDQEANSKSVFGQATWNVSPRLRVIGSLRYTSTHKEATFGGRLVYGPFALRPVNTTAAGSFTENLTDPSGTVQFDVTQDIMAYAAFGRGSKSGGFVSNTYGTTNADFRYRPERSRNYEIGLKFAALDRKIVGNVALYNTRFKNLQVSVYNPTTSSYLTGNAASATSKGVEGQLTVRPVRGLDITATGAYQDIKYNEYPGAACLASQTLAQCNPASPASIAANNLAGYRPSYTSKWTGSLQAHHRLLIGDYKIDTTGVASGRSSFFNSDDQSPIYGVQEGYVKYDLRVAFAPQDDKWHIAFVGKNLTNELTTGSVFRLPAPITAAPRSILYVEPSRSLAIEAGFKF